MMKGSFSSPGRNNQAGKPETARSRNRITRIFCLTFYWGAVSLLLVSIFFAVSWISGHLGHSGHRPSESPGLSVLFHEALPPCELSLILKDVDLNSEHLRLPFFLEEPDSKLVIDAYLDLPLQKYIVRLLQRSRALQAAVVVLNPYDGRVLAMASFDGEERGENLCLKADFPAASLFKIISAAAAMEKAGFTPNEEVFFTGSKHTLYRRQLERPLARGASKTKFKDAFASSINPVFGKLGIHHLGQDMLAEYAEKFLFNRWIRFDLPVGVSTMEVSGDAFQLAEIASGFNKRTRISPMHAALLASSVANDGTVMRPRLVERVRTKSGDLVYRNEPATLASPISRKTAEDLKILMEETVLHGTCGKYFRKLRRKRLFEEVALGAKTGTINDPGDHFKFDWLTAYALPKDRSKAICVAVLAIHGRLLGIRAQELGRAIISYHFRS